MEGSRDYAQLMHWNGRLRLLSQLQGVYHENLQAQGFDEEQAFMLVRDWSSRAWEWTLREEPLPFDEELPAAPEAAPPAPQRRAGEPYLIPVEQLLAEESAVEELLAAPVDEHAHDHEPSSLDDIDEAA